MSIVKIASFGYEIFVMLSSTQSIYNVGSFRQVRVNNVLFIVQYLTKKRIICIVEQISNSCRLFVVVPSLTARRRNEFRGKRGKMPLWGNMPIPVFSLLIY